MPVTILHNPRCSKSRQSLELLTNNGVDAQVILYLQDPPTSSEIKNILKKLNLSPSEILRRGETRFKELAISLEDIDDDQLITLMVENPILIERPIIFNETKAVIGRPPENTLDII
ncbi:MAG: arsenate reductase (glutaredoxin) [Gammaproteobacteria bacterium]|jgi:arsenate reductase|nr:arsenate reductase (glutaredoxin) [Gammaproteobacteria bacterium]|tara:strand:- start:675 stop:1022 length:348 start_codon:yes stop_codon:yes gene_type:complete